MGLKGWGSDLISNGCVGLRKPGVLCLTSMYSCDCEPVLGEEEDWKEGLMKTGDWGEPAPFMMMVSDLGWIRFVLGTEDSAGLYIAYCADILMERRGGRGDTHSREPIRGRPETKRTIRDLRLNSRPLRLGKYLSSLQSTAIIGRTFLFRSPLDINECLSVKTG